MAECSSTECSSTKCSRAACCMTVRDCAPYLIQIFYNLERLKSLFQEFHLIIAYDHCMDGSETLLKAYQWYASYPVYLLPSNETCVHRTVRIANARNRCLEKLETLYVPFHFMIDADDVNCSRWNLSLLKSYLLRDDWDSVSFNRKDYYDIWALMYSPFKHHCWGFSNHCREVVAFMKKDITKRLEQCYEWFPCDSAFNGFAIYRTPLFRGIRYDGYYKNLRTLIRQEDRDLTLHALRPIGLPIVLDETFVQSCEHLYYHLLAKQRNARIYISKYTIF
jgi:hypothetical protein